MMTLAVILAVVSGAVPLGAPFAVSGVLFRGPQGWRETSTEDSRRFVDAKEEGSVEMSAFAVSPERSAAECLDQMLLKLGKAGWERVKVAGQVAAKQVTSDTLRKSGAKDVGEEVTTTTHIGCNGKMKWVMTFTAKSTAAKRLRPVSEAVLASLKYGSGP